MTISAVGLQNLAKSVDLRIEALSVPTGPGEPQVFQIRPPAMLLSAAGDLFPTEAVLNAAIPVEITVKWGVETVDGKPVPAGEALTYSKAAEALETTVMVVPDFVELRAGMDLPVKTRYVTATVTLAVRQRGLTGEESTSTSIELVRHPISVPAVPVPTIALFFAKKDLGMSGSSLAAGDQFVVVLVPRDSPIASMSALRFAFEKLREVSSTARGLAGLVPGGGLTTLGDLGTGLDTIMNALNAHALIGGRVGLAFATADAVYDVNNLDTILGEWVWNNDIEAEDHISSIVLVGPPGRKLRCFEHDKFRGSILTLTAGPRCVTIANKFTMPLTTDPVDHGTGNVALDDQISSVAFL